MVRNGQARPRQVTTVAGAVALTAPWVDDRREDPQTGQRARFRPAILPPWRRRSPEITEMLLLYMHGLSSKDVVPPLQEFLGSGARLSAAATMRLTESWQEEYRRRCERDLSGADYVYCWADGLHLGVRLDADRVCTLVVVGVRADGKKELVALADGHQPQAGLLRDARRGGLRAPVLSVGDGALAFWAALHVVSPEAREQQSWVHAADTLDCLPKSAQPAGRKALAQIRDAEHRSHAQAAVWEIAAPHGAKYLNAVVKITDDADQLLALFDFRAEHWIHLKTSNPTVISRGCWGVYDVPDEGYLSGICRVVDMFSQRCLRRWPAQIPLSVLLFGFTSRTERSAATCLRRKTPSPLGLLAGRLQITIESTFAAVRLRTRVTKGPGSRAAGLAMVNHLIEAASERLRLVNAQHLLALVRAGTSIREGSACRAARRIRAEGRRVINQETPSTTLHYSSAEQRQLRPI
jgi:transposase-like protein